jgi:hypothetical protein
MVISDIRSRRSRALDLGRGAFEALPSRLLRSVGKALGLNQSADAARVEALEQRALLEGSFASPLNLPAPDGAGRIVQAGSIDPAIQTTNNDTYRFVATESGFFTALADTVNEAPASNLNTRIEIYNAQQQLLIASNDNGTVTSGFLRDGWAGWIASTGETYFIVVASQGTAAGSYKLRMTTTNSSFGIDPTTHVSVAPATDPADLVPVLGQLGGLGPVNNRVRQDNIVYRFDVPNAPEWNTMAAINAQVTQNDQLRRLDTRLEIYNAQGALVSSDERTGRVNDAFVSLRVRPGETYFIRVRADEVTNPNIELTTGPFFLVVEARTEKLTLNPVTRRATVPNGDVNNTANGLLSGSLVPYATAPNPAPNPNVPLPAMQTSTFDFVAVGTGQAFITVTNGGLPPINDPAVRVFSEDGTQVGFNDNFAGNFAQLALQLTSGLRYFIFVDGFSLTAGSNFVLSVEANYSIDPTVVQDGNRPVDDHFDTPSYALNTSLNWTDPFLTSDPDRLPTNPVLPLRDRGLRVQATGEGRLFTPGDRDVFQFTAPMDMRNTFTGNNDDQGTSLFIGGNFQLSDAGGVFPVDYGGLSIWDAQDYWFAGDRGTDTRPAFNNAVYGFLDNPATPATPKPEIYAFYDWTPVLNGQPLARRLVVGGDFQLNIPTNDPMQPVITVTNLASYVFDPVNSVWFWSNELGSGTDGPVRAITQYDPVQFDSNGSEPGGDVPDPGDPELYVGGNFTVIAGAPAVNLASFLPGAGWREIPGVAARVNALAVYDAPDPGPGRAAQPGLAAVLDPPDLPSSLYIGTNVDAGNGLRRFDGVTVGLASSGTPAPSGVVNGAVNALTTFLDPDPDGMGPEVDQQVLIVGGNFTNAGGTAAGNLAQWGRIDVTQDPQATIYTPRLLWEQPINLASGPVLALTVWDPPDINNTTIPQVVAIGGQFTEHITTWDGDARADLGLPNGPVRALAAITDAQEPGIPQALVSGNPQQVLYLGGDFTAIDEGTPGEVPARRVAMFNADTFNGVDFFEFNSLSPDPARDRASGVGDVNAQANPSVFALAAFDDGNAGRWDRHDRPATRLQVLVEPIEPGATSSFTFMNLQFRILDSNFNVVYDLGQGGADRLNPLAPDPAGMNDPSLQGVARDTSVDGIQLWGGETYFIEISDTSGAGTGRYRVTLVADGAPVDVDRDGIDDDINLLQNSSDEADEGDLNRAIRIDTAFNSGDGAIIVGSDTQPLRGNWVRTRHVNPSLNTSVRMASDAGVISSVTDSDLYFFRAEFTGTVEFRVGTTNFTDRYGEQQGTNFTGVSKNVSSGLDALLRIFNNDLNQVALNDDFGGYRPDQADGTDNAPIGTIAGEFRSVDPRVVINVVAGENYFVLVESAQRYKDPRPVLPIDPNDPNNPNRRVPNVEREIDAKAAIGSYILLVNQMGAQIQDQETGGAQVLDDHSNLFSANIVAESLSATPIPIGEDPLTPSSNGRGSLTGVINNTPLLNPADTDKLKFVAVGTGTFTVTVTRAPGSTVVPVVDIFRAESGDFVGSASVVGNAWVFSAPASRGDEFLIAIGGQGSSEGGYAVAIASAPFADDHTDREKYWDATDIDLIDFQGRGEASGTLESIGDSDVFRFRVTNADTFTLTVTPTSPTMRPSIEVYEVMDWTATGEPHFLLFRGVAAEATGARIASVSVPVQPDRVIDLDPGTLGVDREYPYYYIVVSGVDAISNFGSYNVQLTFNPTDDHADGDTNGDQAFDTVEFPIATEIAVDSATGLGSATGLLETEADTDLFFATQPAFGTVSISVSQAAGSTAIPRVWILSSTGVILALSQTLGTTSTATLANVARNTQLFFVVDGSGLAGQPTQTGAFTLALSMPPLDDHANATEWTLATFIPISGVTGTGQIGGAPGELGNPRLSYLADTDLFTFTTIAPGSHSVTLTPLDTPLGFFRPRLEVYVSTNLNTPVATATASTNGQAVSITLPSALLSETYFILVQASPTSTGEFRVAIQGPIPPEPPPGTDPAEVDFTRPTVLALNPRNGDGSSQNSANTLPQSSDINPAEDRDLYSFTTLAPGQVFVRLSLTRGSLLDGQITILRRNGDGSRTEILTDTDGIAGATAFARFGAGANETYFVIVDGVGSTTGSYLLEVDTQPAVNRIYFPEGFASDTIFEFIPIVNPNPFPLAYTVRLKYESGVTESVASRAIGANTRDGVTISNGTGQSDIPFLRKNVPYSLVIEWTVPSVNPLNNQPIDPATIQPLGATFSHYDFGSSVGDAFTDVVSPTWTFPRVERNPGGALNFILVYNPHDFSITVDLRGFLSNGTAVAGPSRVIEGGRRGGFWVGGDDFAAFGSGIFSAQLFARATDTANQPAFEGVVSSITAYRTGGGNDAAFAALGDATGGSTTGALTNLTAGQGVVSEFTIFNPGLQPTSVTLLGTYVRTGIASFGRTVQVPAQRAITITGAELGLNPGQPVGVRYTSNSPVSVLSYQEQRGDADGANPRATAGTRFLFGDAFINVPTAGQLFFETLFFYNPTNAINNVEIKLLFFNRPSQPTATINISIPANGFQEVRLHERPEILNIGGPVWYALDISSLRPFQVNMEHYDLFLGGGWAAAGVPFGIQTPLADIAGA